MLILSYKTMTSIPTKHMPAPGTIFFEKYKEYPLTNSKEILILKVEPFEIAIRPKSENFSRDNPKINNQIILTL
jgi:hypothetical protein